MRYPVFIARGGRWSTRPTGALQPAPIWLPREGDLGLDEVYVPAGWFRFGELHKQREVWVDGFVISRFPVTNAQYIAFLDALAARGEVEQADSLVPVRSGADELVPLFVRGQDGRYGELLGPEEPDVPVVHLPWSHAVAFAEARAEQTGRPFRLPLEVEWEKAARGVDGRTFLWGEQADPAWANTLHTKPKPWPCPIEQYPEDESIYGVRGLAGNVADWMLDPFSDQGPIIGPDGRAISPEASTSEGFRSSRGGCWIWHHRYSACSFRTSHPAVGTTGSIGFRLARRL